jgi:ABC-type multidrug transport system fused ATPase/permease subunit
MMPVCGEGVGAAGIAPGDLVTAGSTVVLEARQVRKAYGHHQVLRGVDLAIKPGQLVAVVGENGRANPRC